VNCCDAGDGLTPYPPAAVELSQVLPIGSVLYTSGLYPGDNSVITCMQVSDYTGTYSFNNSYLGIFNNFESGGCSSNRCQRCVFIAQVCGYSDPEIYVRWVIEPGTNIISIGNTYYDSGLGSQSWNTLGSDCLTIVSPTITQNYNYNSASGGYTYSLVSNCNDETCLQ
jgi:hypothetical protein